MTAKLILLGLTLACLTAAKAEANDVLRVTCTQDGRIVYKEELPGNAGQEERMFVYAKNPDALCIFLQDGPTTEAASSQMGIETIMPGKVIGGTSENTPSNDLATALAMISSGKPAPSMPIDLTDAMQKFKHETGTIDVAKPMNKEQQKLLNLTVGIYRSVSADDVISHWKAMQAQGSSLKNLTPTLTNVEDITMLSVENIADENADAICKDAAVLGSGCIAFY